MTNPNQVYCLHCGTPAEALGQFCQICGGLRQPTPQQRLGGLAFILNELRAPRLGAMLSQEQRQHIEDRYAEDIRAMARIARAGAAGPEPAAPRPAAQQPSSAPEPSRAPAYATAAAAPAAPPAMRAAPPRPPTPPREPMDWSWLADQQANLLLFAGAFLVVVAALIYVGYSGQAVDGSLKMSLLTGYTIAFLAAGWYCLRAPRVEVAGKVFFGVGALLVPLNFVAAYNIFSDEQLSAESMWLAGSLTTAAFYTAVAAIGFGRQYAYAAGAALASSVLAALVLGEAPVEWWGIAFLALAGAMASVKLSAPELPGNRIGVPWTLEAHALAIGGVLLATGVAIIGALDIEDDLALAEARGFLPLTFAVAAAYASLHAFAHRDELYGAGLIAAVSGAFVTVFYALSLPPEAYAIAFAALALCLGATTWALVDAPDAERLPPQFSARLLAAALTSAVTAGAVAALMLFLSEARDEAGEIYLVLDTRWFVAAAAALTLAFFTLDAFGLRRREGLAGAAVSLAALAVGVVYGRDLHPEHYAYALTGAAIVLVGFARWVAPRMPKRLRPEGLAHDAVWAAQALALVGVATALVVALLAVSSDAEFALQTRWTLFGAFTSALAVYVVYASMPMPVLDDGADRTVTWGLALAFTGAAASLVYALDASPEWYAFAFAAGSAAAFALGAWVLPHLHGDALPSAEDATLLGHAAALTSAVIAVGAALVATGDDTTYTPDSRWFLPAVFAALIPGYAIAFTPRLRAVVSSRDATAIALMLVPFGVTTGIVYALRVSPEYHAFALLAPALAAAVAARFARSERLDAVAAAWRDDLVWAARLAATTGTLVALGAALIASDEAATYAPQSRIFLPIAIALAATVAVFDASRARRLETSVASLAALIAVAPACVYAGEGGPAVYGLAIALAALGVGLAGRAWLPDWIDERARDGVAAAAVTIGWLPFMLGGAFADAPRYGAATLFAAALVYATIALLDRGTETFNRLLGLPERAPVRLAVGWLYAAGIAATLGYIFVLRSLPAAEDAEAGTLSGPLMMAGLALLAGGATTRFWRAEFRPHFYAMSLVLALGSMSLAGDAGALTLVLAVFVAGFAAAAIWDDAPLLGAPAMLFGFALVPAWRSYADAAAYWPPLAYTAIALTLYAAGVATRRSLPRWSRPLRAVGAVYAMVAPAAGFGMMLSDVDGEARRTSALYQWSTAAVAIAGVLAVLESSLARRGWVAVLGSGALLVAVLLQVGRFEPQNIQAYTSIAGVYLVVLGMVGLWRLRLVPDMDGDNAQIVEAIGAATVMLPSFLQSFDGGWYYTMLLVVEAAAFFSLSVALRRRGLLATALVFLVLLSGRALFDAIHAMPNWIVILLAGMALLSAGLAILAGRERWEEIERRLLGWWNDLAAE